MLFTGTYIHVKLLYLWCCIACCVADVDVQTDVMWIILFMTNNIGLVCRSLNCSILQLLISVFCNIADEISCYLSVCSHFCVCSSSGNKLLLTSIWQFLLGFAAQIATKQVVCHGKLKTAEQGRSKALLCNIYVWLAIQLFILQFVY